MRIELLNPDLSALPSKKNSLFESFAKITDDLGETIGHIIVCWDGIVNLTLVSECTCIDFDHRELQLLAITSKNAYDTYMAILIEKSEFDIEHERLFDHDDIKKELG